MGKSYRAGMARRRRRRGGRRRGALGPRTSSDWLTPMLTPLGSSPGSCACSDDVFRVQAAHKTLELLPLSTTFEMQVRAQNVAGWSGWSPAASITTPSASTR